MSVSGRKRLDQKETKVTKIPKGIGRGIYARSENCDQQVVVQAAAAPAFEALIRQLTDMNGMSLRLERFPEPSRFDVMKGHRGTGRA